MDRQNQKKHTFFGHVLMEFHPTFSNKNDQNHPNQEPLALKPISIVYSKALTQIFWLLKRVYFYMNRTGRVRKNRYFLPGFDAFHPIFSNKNDQNHFKQEPRALKLINIAYLKTLTSVFWLLKRVF